ncbi:MAG: Coenzyme F420 hydrogenase/dehydrogenase, beta subunit C-terminal domain [Dehalococcoidales bacterium]|nr:Coenzyme F420 hydrogenase/dehydrogenase, beta subunit C-terminal domain [Dehalococcoidales bacterium]
MNKNKTIDQVSGEGLCTGCGTCAGVCPQNAIKMVIDQKKGIYLPRLDREKCNECGICFKVCPGHSVDFNTLNREIFGREVEDILLGNYLGFYTGFSTDNAIRYHSTSGGLVTELLIFALEEGIIDGALVTRMSIENPLIPESFVARTREDIISAARSKYCPVTANIALKEIPQAGEGERFAVVGLPCHLHGLRKAGILNNKIKQEIMFCFGLFCNHTPTFTATDYILHKVKIRREDVKKLVYRGEGWPGKMKISLKNKKILLKEFWDKGFGTLFYPWRCSLCVDAVSELSDISFGDAWIGEHSKDSMGTSLVISRSGKGEELLNNALDKGVISLAPVTRNKVIWSTRQITRFKKDVPARFSILRGMGRQVPEYNLTFPKPGVTAYLSSLYCYFRMYLGKKHFLWGLLWYLSCWSGIPGRIVLRIIKSLGLFGLVTRIVRGF